MGNDKRTASEWSAPMFQPGDKVKDDITGFVGIITGRSEYITGCEQFSVQPPVDDTGKFIDGRWIDGDRLVLVEAAAQLHQVTKAGFGDPAPMK